MMRRRPEARDPCGWRYREVYDMHAFLFSACRTYKRPEDLSQFEGAFLEIEHGVAYVGILSSAARTAGFGHGSSGTLI